MSARLRRRSRPVVSRSLVMRAFVDLHCHSRGSFNSLSVPSEMVRAARERGLTHLAITDHDRIDVAQEMRGAGAGRPDDHRRRGSQDPRWRTSSACSSSRPSRPGCPARATIDAAREQGGLVGIPHPFDRMRGSLLRDATMASLAPLVDWVEVHNARVVGHGNEDAATFALEQGLPGVAVSDAHSIVEIGVAYTALEGDPSTPAGLLAALSNLELEIVPGRASFVVRLWTPLAKGRQPAPRQRSGTAVGPGVTDRQDHRSMAEPTDEPLRSEAMEATPAIDSATRRPAGPNKPADPANSGRVRRAGRARRARRCTAVARPASAPAAHDPVDRRAARDHQLLPVSQRRAPGRGPEPDPQGQPAAGAAGVLRVLPRLPVAWLPLEAAPGGAPTSRSRCAARSRSCTSRGSSTASCRPSSVTCTAPTCSR